MSFESQIETLKSLTLLDGRIVDLKATLEVERAGIDEKSQRHAALAIRSDKLEAKIAEMESTKGDLIGEQRQLGAQVEKSREKLARVRNEKEANAVQRELEELRRLSRERESEVQQLAGFIEEARGDLTKVVVERDEAAQQVGDTESEAVTKVRALETEFHDITRKRDEALSGLGGVLRRRYETIVKIRGTAVSSAAQGRCKACHIELPPMMFQKLMQRRELDYCPNCHRILYFEPAVVSAPEADDAENESAAADES
ncbi:MAG: C4-type zinc ribbon domain-containing protein [Polyangiaceae bacterium]|nr:C4-type zinc ribbon domain-containing protein [Polyangiaceae bacterium]